MRVAQEQWVRLEPRHCALCAGLCRGPAGADFKTHVSQNALKAKHSITLCVLHDQLIIP